MNIDELARNKFNALFAAHDAKEIRATVPPRDSALKAAKKPAKKAVESK